MVRKAGESFGGDFRVLADEAKQVEVFFWRLARELVEELRLYFGAEDRADFFVPARIDAIEFLRARVDQSFNHATLLIEARRGERAAFDGIENAKEMLAFAENDLRSANGFALPGIANQIRTSHISITP